MPKKGMKNFICSFILSLLAVIAVNKAVFHTPALTENKVAETKKKVQNISLFSEQKIPVETASANKSVSADLSAIENLTSQPEKIASAEISDNPSYRIKSEELPPPDSLFSQLDTLETAAPVSESNSEVKAEMPITVKLAQNKIDTGINAAEQIVLEEEKPAVQTDETQEKTDEYKNSGIVYADISDTIEDEQKQNITVDNSSDNIIYGADNAAPILVADNSGASGKIVVAATGEKPQAAIVFNAKNKITGSEISADEKETAKITLAENDEIPLVESSEILHKNVDVLQTADVTQVAMLEPNNLVSSIEDLNESEPETLAEANLKQNEWVQMSEKAEDSPWVIAKGNKFAKNRAVVEEFAGAEENLPSPTKKNNSETEADKNLNEDGLKNDVHESLNLQTNQNPNDETKVAYKMIQNLLIPIPDEILNDAELTPQLSSSPNESPQEKKQAQKAERMAVQKSEQLKESEKQSGLFKSIASWFSGEAKNDQSSKGANSSSRKKKSSKSGISFFGGTDDNPETQGSAQIMPAELRLSFQPNRAEISGQTLRWIHAFADNARDNDSIYIEIRIDGTSSFALQQKRLNLLSTILANRGVDFRKINIVFTSREPNSFIIRNIRFNSEEEVVVNKNNNNAYYQPW